LHGSLTTWGPGFDYRKNQTRLNACRVNLRSVYSCRFSLHQKIQTGNGPPFRNSLRTDRTGQGGFVSTSCNSRKLSGKPKKQTRAILFRPEWILCVLMAAALFHQNAYAQGPLTNGANHTGAISIPGEIDTWTFDATKNDAISLSIGEVFLTEKDP